MKAEDCFPWKEGEWEQRVRDLMAEGLRPKQIAQLLTHESRRPVTRDMVARKAKRLKIILVPADRLIVGVPADDPKARIAELWNAGVSAGVIAKQLGVTRNSIMGKVHRMGLPGRGHKASCQAANPRPDRRQQGTSAAMAKIQTQKLGRIASHASIVPAQVTTAPAPSGDPWKWDAQPLPGSRPALLVDLEEDQCRWPLEELGGVRGRHLMCGAPQLDGCPYCMTHWGRSSGAAKSPAMSMWRDSFGRSATLKARIA